MINIFWETSLRPNYSTLENIALPLLKVFFFNIYSYLTGGVSSSIVLGYIFELRQFSWQVFEYFRSYSSFLNMVFVIEFRS